MDNIDLSDYYVSISYLDNLPENNIEKWIESGNSKKVERKLDRIYENGGSFSSNNYNVISTDLVSTPFLYEKNGKWYTEYIETRHIHFFPNFHWKSSKVNISIKNKIEVPELEEIIKYKTKNTLPEESYCSEAIKMELNSPKKKKKIYENPQTICSSTSNIDIDTNCLTPEKANKVSNAEAEIKRKNKSKKHDKSKEINLNESINTTNHLESIKINTDNSVMVNGDKHLKKKNEVNNSIKSKIDVPTLEENIKFKTKRKLPEENYCIETIKTELNSPKKKKRKYDENPQIVSNSTNNIDLDTNCSTPKNVNEVSNPEAEIKPKKKSKKHERSLENNLNESPNTINHLESVKINADNFVVVNGNKHTKKKKKSHKEVHIKQELKQEESLSNEVSNQVSVKLSEDKYIIKEKKHKKKKHLDTELIKKEKTQKIPNTELRL